MTLAQVGLAGSVGHMVIIGLVIVGIVAIALIAARAAGVNVPGWLVQILWVVLAIAVGIVAIKVVLSLL